MDTSLNVRPSTVIDKLRYFRGLEKYGNAKYIRRLEVYEFTGRAEEGLKIRRFEVYEFTGRAEEGCA